MVMFPSSTSPTGQTMNYTVVVSGGWVGLCIIYFYFPKYGGVYWFEGPIATIDAQVPKPDSGSYKEVKEESSLTESHPM